MVENADNNPNRMFVYPRDVYKLSPTFPEEMLTGKPEDPKFSTREGEEIFEVENYKSPADQMLLVSMLAGRPGEKPIVPCSAIIAHKVPRSGITGDQEENVWRYYSHRTRAEDLSNVTVVEALACELFLWYVFTDYDHQLLHRENLQVMRAANNITVQVAFHDFSAILGFWALKKLPLDTKRFNTVLHEFNTHTNSNISEDAVREELITKLDVFERLLANEAGIEYIESILQYIPETPRVIQMADITGSIRKKTKIFRDSLLERIHATKALFAPADDT